MDLASGAVLDTRTISNFQEGVYLSWRVTGGIRVRCTRLSGSNALVNGIFVDPSASGGSGGTSTKAAGIVNGSFNLQIAGETGQKFKIYCSTDLANWTLLTDVTLSSPTLNFLDTTSTGKALRFYRAVAAP
jgi:hypothetical protein